MWCFTVTPVHTAGFIPKRLIGEATHLLQSTRAYLDGTGEHRILLGGDNDKQMADGRAAAFFDRSPKPLPATTKSCKGKWWVLTPPPRPPSAHALGLK